MLPVQSCSDGHHLALSRVGTALVGCTMLRLSLENQWEVVRSMQDILLSPYRDLS